MLLFMFLDVCCVLAAAIFSCIPSTTCPKTNDGSNCKIVPASSQGLGCTDAAPECVCLGSVKTPFQVIPLVYLVVKAVAVSVLLRMVFRDKRPKRLQFKGIKQEWVYGLRLALSAVFLPPLGLCLVAYVVREFRAEAEKRKLIGDGCSFELPVSWWVLAVLYALMSLMFVVEAIVFVFCPGCYLRGGRFSRVSDTQLSPSSPKKTGGGSSERRAKSSSKQPTTKTKKTKK